MDSQCLKMVNSRRYRHMRMAFRGVLWLQSLIKPSVVDTEVLPGYANHFANYHIPTNLIVIATAGTTPR